MTAAIQASALPDQVLEFTLGADRYCVGIDCIEEIVTANDVTSLPNTPPQVAGVMDLRGQSTTILDPSVVFDIETSETNRQVVVFDSDQRIGWLVDQVHRVSSLDDATVDDIPDATHISGVISDDGGFIIWVDPDTVNDSVSV